MAVGRRLVSPVDITGNSSGRPPASQTPRFTRSASARKCALHGVSSDQVLQIPMTGGRRIHLLEILGYASSFDE